MHVDDYNGIMNGLLIDRLSKITEEEREILNGKTDVNRSLYYSSNKKDEIDSSMVLKNGKLIDLRPHTRFIHFPAHTHNYVEFVYMAKGNTTHIIDGETILLNEGDLLFLNQHAVQEIEDFAKGGLVASGTNPKTGLVEVVELPTHPFFVGVQFHPEYKSTPERPHPLFVSFVGAAINNAKI